MSQEFEGSTRTPNLRSNSLQEGEDYVYTESHHQEDEIKETSPTLEGLMARGKLKKIQEKVGLHSPRPKPFSVAIFVDS
ncbi:hypothetical protein CR513_17175, partial [Mucuna pruriens]